MLEFHEIMFEIFEDILGLICVVIYAESNRDSLWILIYLCNQHITMG